MKLSFLSVACSVLTAVFSSCGGEPTAPEASAPPVASEKTSPSAVEEPEHSTPQTPPLVMKLRTLQDKGVGNMESHTILAPKDWTVEGGAWWPPQPYFNVLPSREIVARSPEGVFVRIAPGVTANDYKPSAAAQQMGIQRMQVGASDNGYPVIYFPGTKSAWKKWIQKEILPSDFPNAKKIRVKKVEEVAELKEGFEQMMAPMFQQMEQSNQQSAAMGMGMRQWGEVLSYAFEGSYEEDGQDFEFVLVLACIVNGMEMEMGRQVSWTIEPCFTLGAPKGELEENAPLLMTILSSVRETPQWAKMKQDHINTMQGIAAKGAADRAKANANAAAARADSGPSVGDILHEGWKKRNAISDGGQSRVINSINEVQNYSSSGSSVSVQLPSNFGNVYSNGNGEYLLTDDALYNPNIDPNFNGSNWDTMTPVE